MCPVQTHPPPLILIDLKAEESFLGLVLALIAFERFESVFDICDESYSLVFKGVVRLQAVYNDEEFVAVDEDDGCESESVEEASRQSYS